MSAAETGIALDSFSSSSGPERYRARYDPTETPAMLAVVAIRSTADEPSDARGGESASV